MDWMPTRPGPVISARYMAVPPHEPGPQRQLHGLHLHGGILVEEAARLHQDLLAGAERALQDVAVAVQQQQARVLGRDEPVHEHAAAAVQHVRQPLDPDERVLDAVRGQQEGVLADVQFHPRVQRQHDQLARRVPGERDPAWPARHRDDVRHAAERALHPALRLQRGERRRLVFPQQHVVLEVNGVLRGEVDLRDGDQFAFHLARAAGKTELGHVPQPGGLAPAGIADLVLNVERRAACHTRGGSWLILCVAPPALDCFHARKIAVQDGFLLDMSAKFFACTVAPWHCSRGNLSRYLTIARARSSSSGRTSQSAASRTRS